VQTVRFRLDISPDRLLAYYRGNVEQVSVVAEDGRRIQFPAQWLRGHVRRDGVHGRFQLRFREDRRLISLTRIDD
jgi:hypothetical protein